ncbi:MAG: SDR family NAD(P)-dependent oxidoreductase [Pseudomonadota bacterium]
MEKIVISGVTSGLGTEWLYKLDTGGPIEFFILARNKEKLRSLLNRRPLSNKAHFISCDFSSLASVNLASEEVFSRANSIDVLINNAGMWGKDDIQLSEDQIELTFAVNQLAPYALTGRLMPLLLNSTNPRVVNTASFRHSGAKIAKDDIELRRNFNAELAYCNSKLFNILFTRQLAKITADSPLRVNCFDPGIVNTPMLKVGFPEWLSVAYPLIARLVARSPKRGAETGVFLSKITRDEKISGEYFKDKKIKKVSSLARDADLAEWLWSQCESFSGLKYPQLE